jgi:hypothetical protein
MGCTSSKSAAAGTLDTINPFAAHGDPHSRCSHMLKEAATLARVATAYERDLKKVQDALTSVLESGAVVCATPLPGLYNDTAGVAASAVVATAEPIGGPNFTLQAGTSAKGDLSGKLASDTIKPISDWIARFHDALAHQKAVDKAYDELEAARKKVTSQKDRIEKTRGQLASNPKASDRMAAEESTLQGLATKLSSAELNHTNLEAAQHARVTSLNKVGLRAAHKDRLGTHPAALMRRVRLSRLPWCPHCPHCYLARTHPPPLLHRAAGC